MNLTLTATREGRLSSFLLEELRMSAGLMNRVKWKEAILVNGKPEYTDYAVKPGDVITVLLDEPEPDYPAEEGDLTVLYEDEYLLTVDKPAGMLIHPSRSCFSGTLANFVTGYYRQTGQKCAFHPVTRLDRDTFGVVLLAKNSHIHNLMQASCVEKIYHAYVWGHPQNAQGVIDAPIARKPLPSLLREIREDGKPSVTEYWILEQEGKLCKLKLRPVTGRTHQLRLHCAYTGFPILGDPQYASAESKEFSEQAGLLTQQLCAKELKFCHPMTGDLISLESKLNVVSHK